MEQITVKFCRPNRDEVVTIKIGQQTMAEAFKVAYLNGADIHKDIKFKYEEE